MFARIAAKRIPFACAARSRGLKFLAKEYGASSGFSRFSQELETDIRHTLADLPKPSQAFKNEDGTARKPSDVELEKAAAVSALSGVGRATLWDRFRMSKEQLALLDHNTYAMEEFFLYGRRILDKIPVLDKHTGEVTWQVITDAQKEGWEPLMYYLYVPGLLIALGFYYFLDKDDLGDWAMEELKLRAQERMGPVNEPDAKKRDELIIEQIISGDYDRLTGLRKAGKELPSSLL